MKLGVNVNMSFYFDSNRKHYSNLLSVLKRIKIRYEEIEESGVVVTDRCLITAVDWSIGIEAIRELCKVKPRYPNKKLIAVVCMDKISDMDGLKPLFNQYVNNYVYATTRIKEIGGEEFLTAFKTFLSTGIGYASYGNSKQKMSKRLPEIPLESHEDFTILDNIYLRNLAEFKSTQK